MDYIHFGFLFSYYYWIVSYNYDNHGSKDYEYTTFHSSFENIVEKHGKNLFMNI